MAAEPDQRERKLATVLFADLVGSTALGASQDPERTRLTLERFYAAMAEEVDLAGGTVEKFAGDAVMATFGAPSSLEDHAERALHAALAMQRRMSGEFADRLALRVGINTGEVVVGAPREGSSFVTGDPVNVAARLEQAAEPGEILVGERTVNSVRGAFEFDDPQMVAAKGKPDGIAARRLLRALTLMRPRGVHGLQRAFVGRDVEMQTLQDAYEAVVGHGTPRLVTLLGDAGVGKSRLVREFWEWLGSRNPEPLRRTGRCLAYGRGTTYWPLAEVLREHLGILEGDDPALVLARLEPRPILGMTLGLDVAGDLHPLVARDHFQDAWVAWVNDVSADRPLVLLIEDLHWAEDLLLDLLERVVTDGAGPVLLIATARPELLDRRPRWGVSASAVTVALEPLDERHASQMLTGLLGGQLPSGLQTVAERAEGNPFFVEELLATLIDRQLLDRTNGEWRLLALPADFEVPDTVQAVVAARMDLLGPAEKQALQAAAVIGRVFWADPVYQLVAEGQPDLRVLEDRDFIRRRSGSSMPGQREYAIKHALTREVAYDSIPRARRAHMHAGVANWVEAAVGPSDEVAPILAHHFAEAVRPDDLDLAWPQGGAEVEALREKAINWLTRAGQLAIGRMEVDDGIDLLQRARELEVRPREQASIWREIGHAYILKFDGEGFWTAMQNALALDDERSAAADVYGELAIQTTSRRGMWMRRPSSDLIEGWIRSALELAAPGSPAEAKARIAEAWLARDAALAQHAANLAEGLGDVHLRSLAWHGQETAALSEGDFFAAYESSRRQVDLIASLNDPDRITYILGNASAIAQYVGRVAEARALARQDLATSRRLSSHHRLHGWNSVVSIEASSGDWEAVRAITPDMEAAFEANRATPCVLGPVGLLVCAEAATRGGDDAESARLERLATDFGMEGYAMFFGPGRVALRTARHDLEGLRQALEEWEPGGFEDVEGEIAWLNAMIALGERARIEEHAAALAVPGTYLEPFVLRALAYARGDQYQFDRAITIFEEMGLDTFADETRAMATKLGPAPDLPA